MKTFRVAFLILVLVAILGVLIAQGPDQAGAQYNTACYSEQGGAKRVAGDDCEYEFQSGAALDIQSGTVFTYNSVAMSGPTRFGATSNVISGTLIAHGIGTTPTMVLLTPQYNDTLTQTAYVMATNATSFTVGISPGSVVTMTAVNWLAGK